MPTSQKFKPCNYPKNSSLKTKKLDKKLNVSTLKMKSESKEPKSVLFFTISSLATFNLNTKETKPLKSLKLKLKMLSTFKPLQIYLTSNYPWDHTDATTRKMVPLYSSPVLWGILLSLIGGKKN